MKGYIFIKAKPQKGGCTLKGRVNLNGVNAAGKCALLEVILRRLEIDTDLARVFLDVIEKEQEDNPHE
jgi:Ni2+-binding GTPase involved in maturation of urease and hydrogenase